MKKYGNLRKYKKFLRDRNDYRNPSEQEFEKIAKNLNLDFTRKGYPDYIILKNGEIEGFVEIKPSKNSKLRPSQERFNKFCKRHNIPFFQWCPGDGNTMPFN